MPRMMFIAIAPAIAKFFKLPLLAKTPTNFLAGIADKKRPFRTFCFQV